MKITKFAAILATVLSVTALSHGQTILYSDNFNVPDTGTGFGATTGVNTSLTSPRITSSLPALRYSNFGSRGGGNYMISNGVVRVNGATANGAFVLTTDGSTPYNFASSLGAATATAANPARYEISLGMLNNYGAGPRFSFGLMTTLPVDGTGSAGFWDFGIQLDRANGSTSATETGLDVFGRMDSASTTLVGDQNFLIQGFGAGTYGTRVDVVLRITDAGAETDSFNSKVEVSLDGGNSFIYSTGDGEFRFDEADRYFVWDMAGNGANGGFGEYDNFVVTVPEPSTFALAGLGGAALLYLRRRMNSRK